MRVLVACEESQAVCCAFRKKGHEAYSCDIQDCSGGYPEWHIKGDVLPLLKEKWDLIIAHPPCTRISNSGVRWLRERNLWEDLSMACDFFKEFINANCDKIAVENPIPHKYALEKIGVKYTQIIQPWMFGHGETKATCLWLKGLIPLTATNIVNGRSPRIHMLPPSPDRAKIRSKTYTGIANAMAEQWG